MEKTLQRFLDAQEDDYAIALREMRHGYKYSHWMWYIFPQISGLGFSRTAQYFEIKNIDETKEYINHPILGKRLIEISQVLLKIESNDAREVMGYPDDLKLKSCMTLFSIVAPEEKVFKQVLDKFFCGEFDEKTIEILEKMK